MTPGRFTVSLLGEVIAALRASARIGVRNRVGARYSATPLAWGDASPVRFGMIRVRDIAAAVPDLLSAQRLDCALHAIGGIQECGDPRAAPSGERPAAIQGRSPPSARYPGHSFALARRRDHTTMDRQAPAVRTSTHIPAAAQGDCAHGGREPAGATDASPVNSPVWAVRSAPPRSGRS